MLHKKVAYVLLRISLGMILFFYGVDKFIMGPNAFADNLVTQFAKTPLPPSLVRAFGMALPFVETLLGLAVMLGVLTLEALVLAAVFFMLLGFGSVMLLQAATVAQNLLYTLTAFFLIFFYEYNAAALQSLWTGRRRKAEVREIPPARAA